MWDKGSYFVNNSLVTFFLSDISVKTRTVVIVYGNDVLLHFWGQVRSCVNRQITAFGMSTEVEVPT